MAKVKQSPKVKLAQKVIKRAAELTKEELKSKEIKKTIITYPKGLYDKTKKKNYEKARKEIGLAKAKPAKKVAKKKSTTKKTVRKSTSKKKK